MLIKYEFLKDHMAAFDRLLAKRVTQVVKNNLGDNACQKIEQRLFEKYGVNLTQAIEDFHKLDSVLREFFGAGADGLEQRFLQNICSKKSAKNSQWLTIPDSYIASKILEAYGDEDKQKILSCVSNESMIVSKILEKSKIPQTSGYRKINQLISDGLLYVDGHQTSHDGRKVNMYKALIENMKINILKNKISIDVQIKPEQKGTILETIKI